MLLNKIITYQKKSLVLRIWLQEAQFFLIAYSPNDTAFFNINMVLITLWNTDSKESLLVFSCRFT